MEKELFIDVLKHYHKSSESEALNIVALKQNFPYSQVLQVLSARVGKDHGYDDSQNALQMAAVYAADRSVLKDVMTKDYLQPAPIRDIQSYHMPAPILERVFERSEYVESNEEANTAYSNDNEVVLDGVTDNRSTLITSPSNGYDEADSAGSRESEVVIQAGVGVSREGNIDPNTPLLPGADGSVADQVMGDLEKLSLSRHNFEEMFKDFEKTFATVESSESPVVNSDSQNNDTASVQDNVLSEPLDENEYSVTQHEESKPHPAEPDEFKSRTMPRRKLQPPTIIDEIEHTKEELEPENPKQKEQLEMIDQFIRTQPSLTASRDKQFELADSDLNTIRTGEFSDNIVSETLVEILLKQGKKDKAIEVLKKLIWKFPQKKAYFAAQIEELKK